MLELAARSIGGLCARAVRFPGGTALDKLRVKEADKNALLGVLGPMKSDIVEK